MLRFLGETALAVSGFGSTPTFLPGASGGVPRIQALPQSPREHLVAAPIAEEPEAEEGGC